MNNGKSIIDALWTHEIDQMSLADILDALECRSPMPKDAVMLAALQMTWLRVARDIEHADEYGSGRTSYSEKDAKLAVVRHFAGYSHRNATTAETLFKFWCTYTDDYREILLDRAFPEGGYGGMNCPLPPVPPPTLYGYYSKSAADMGKMVFYYERAEGGVCVCTEVSESPTQIEDHPDRWPDYKALGPVTQFIRRESRATSFELSPDGYKLNLPLREMK